MIKRKINLVLPVIVLIFHLVIIFLSLVILLSDQTPGGGSFDLESMIYPSLIIILGACFTFSDKDGVLKKVGYSLIALMGVIYLGSAVGTMIAESNSVVPVVNEGPLNSLMVVYSIILIITPIQYLILELLSYFGFVRVSNNEGKSNVNHSNDRVNQLKKWNKLLSSNSITPEQYSSVKNIILNNNSFDEIVLKLNEIRDLLELKLVNVDDLNAIIAN